MSSEDVTVSGISILAALNWSTVAMQAIKGPPGNWKLWTFLISPWVAAMPGGEILCVSVTAWVLLEIERDERRRGAPEHQEGFFWARASLRRDGEGGGREREARPSHWLSRKQVQHLSPAAAPSQPVWGSGQQEGKETLWRASAILLPGLSDCSCPENKDLQQKERRIIFVKPNSGFKVACKKKKEERSKSK